MDAKLEINRIGGHHHKRFLYHDSVLDELCREPYSLKNIVREFYHGAWYFYHDALM